MRRFVLVLLLVIPGVVVVCAGSRETRHPLFDPLAAPSSIYFLAEQLDHDEILVLRRGDLIGRLCAPIDLRAGEQPEFCVVYEEE